MSMPVMKKHPKKHKRLEPVQEILFSDPDEVLEIIDGMRRMINDYSYATVADYMSLCGLPLDDLRMRYCGWKKIDGFKTGSIECPNEFMYKLELPAPVILTDDPEIIRRYFS